MFFLQHDDLDKDMITSRIHRPGSKWHEDRVDPDDLRLEFNLGIGFLCKIRAVSGKFPRNKKHYNIP